MVVTLVLSAVLEDFLLRSMGITLFVPMNFFCRSTSRDHWGKKSTCWHITILASTRPFHAHLPLRPDSVLPIRLLLVGAEETRPTDSKMASYSF